MREIRDFILTVIAATIIGFCSHIWYLENIHTHNSGESARLCLLFGRQPVAKKHVREYSLREVHGILGNKLEIVEEWYSTSIDRVFIRENRVPKILLYPFKRVYPRFRMTIFIVARKMT